MSTGLEARLQQALDSDYILERELGGGGMSRVFVALEPTLGRRVVVKALQPDLFADVGVERFRHEMLVVAQLRHPHIVPVLAASRVGDELLYYIMPYVEGESLRQRLERGPVPVAELVHILCDVTDALGHAHRHGVVHRDIKPENILLADGHALLVDFGIARALALTTCGSAASRGLTGTGVSVGTPAYMAPEQIGGSAETDERADFYALGVVAYEMLAGRHPFAGANAQALLVAHLTQTPEPLRPHDLAIDPMLAALVLRLMEKDPVLRPASAAEVLGVLEHVAAGAGGRAGPPGHARPAPPPTGRTPLAPWMRRAPQRPAMAMLATGAALLVAVGVRWVRSPRAVPAPALASSITVTSFADRSADTLDAYLAPSLTEDIIRALSRTGTARIERARPGSPSATFMLSGSVQRDHERLHVAAHLERTASGDVVWTTRVDTSFAATAAVPEILARRLLAAVGAQPAGAAARSRAENPNRDAQAYDLYLRGQYQLARRSQSAVGRAVVLFTAAVARDSTFAPAWAGLASALEFADTWSFALPGIPVDSLMTRAASASARALELDTLTPEVWVMRAQIARGLDPTSRTATLAALRTAIALDSLNPLAWHQLALTLEELDMPAAAVRAWRRALVLDPGYVTAMGFLAQHFFWWREYDSAAAWAARALSADPTSLIGRQQAWRAALERGQLSAAEVQATAALQLGTAGDRVQALGGLAETAVAMGDSARARTMLARAVALTDSVRPGTHAVIALAGGYTALGDHSRAIAWLRRHHPTADLHFQLHLRHEPALDPLRHDPRFLALLRTAT